MAPVSYLWRQLTADQRQELLSWRTERKLPRHSPPHVRVNQSAIHLSAACYEHQPYIGACLERLDSFTHELIVHIEADGHQVAAWCVLPNHYHVLVLTGDNLALVRVIGGLHGRMSHAWNGEEGTRGRKVFFRCIDKPVCSERHFQATVNYIHNNPVHHGYVERCVDWPWSSARAYLEALGDAEVCRRWREYPVLDMGRNWDAAEL